jgi:uncharacterized RDD family membrane protein YckC
MQRGPIVKTRHVSGIALQVLAVLLLAASSFVVVAAKVANTWALVGAGGIGLMAGIALLRFSRRLRADSVTEILAKDTRPPVVYLRSFRADDRAARGESSSFVRWIIPNPVVALQTSTEEEQIAHVLSSVGPVIALGRPTELLGTAGAAKEYADDLSWQGTILRWMKSAALVVVRAGDTPGLRWELEKCLEWVRNDRLVVLTPKKKSEYDAFVAWAQPLFKHPLPPFTGGSDASFGGVLTFDRDGNARLQPVSVSIGQAGLDRRLARAFSVALRNALASAGLRSTDVIDAPWRARFFAAALDFAAPIFVLYATSAAIRLRDSSDALPRALEVGVVLMAFAALLWPIFAFALMAFTVGGSVGLRAAGIRIIDGDLERRPTVYQSLIRSVFVALLGWTPLTILAAARLMPFVPDLLARTRVVTIVPRHGEAPSQPSSHPAVQV